MAEHKSFKSFLKSNSTYLGEWDLPNGQDIIVTIKDVKEATIIGDKGRSDKKFALYFEEPVKPLFCNITNGRILTELLGTRFVDEWVGAKIQLYFDPEVSFGGKKVGGIRIRDKLPAIEKKSYKCSICGKEMDANTYEQTIAQFGKAFCSKDCYEKSKKGEKIL